MSHYVCRGGCNSVADEPDTCKIEECEGWGEPLEQCDCEDNEHKEDHETESEGNNSIDETEE